MKLRAPSYPLISVDPYLNVWSMGDFLNRDSTRHWTGKSCAMTGVVTIDGTDYCFMGDPGQLGIQAIPQTSVEMTPFSTIYIFNAAGVRLTARFTSPLLPDNRMMLSRPVSYLWVASSQTDGRMHTVAVTIRASEEFCLDHRGQMPVRTQAQKIEGIPTIRMGGIEQTVLGKSGDDIRIDWGYFYLSVGPGGTVFKETNEDTVYICGQMTLDMGSRPAALFTFAYDDIDSIVYHGKYLKAYWKKDGQTIMEAITLAHKEYADLMQRCRTFEEQLVGQGRKAGGKKYAELLTLSLRQVLAAHKLVLDENGEVLYISKECFSNGCAATVDVSYPSMPLFLLYDTELVKGMMRPIFRMAADDAWPFEFAPHDTGIYPILNGQVYARGTDRENQMPVEECGNMLIMAAAVTAADHDPSFAERHKRIFDQWADYLLQTGVDPDNQLCTDDFAGHLAHNCNLSIKAIIALGAYAKVCEMLGDEQKEKTCQDAARRMAAEWEKMAANGDGSYRLAFDKPGTFSMKYNLVWDKLFGLRLFEDSVVLSEVESYFKQIDPYGLPLDNRADYTKSDWLVWVATLACSQEQFEKFIHPLWLAYHLTPSRVPMTDWYSAVTSLQKGFQNRTVQGGIFIKLLEKKGLCRF